MSIVRRAVIVRGIGTIDPHPYTTDYPSIMTSEPFKIIVQFGSRRDRSTKSGLLASLSPSLDALVNGGMREPRERCVTWNMQQPLFACFIKFAYTGTYDASTCPCLHVAQAIDSECTEALRLSRISIYLAQSSVHIHLMIFADYRDIQSLYDEAFDRLKVTLGPFHKENPITGARVMLIKLLGQLVAPGHVIKYVMQVVAQDAKLLWEHDGFREALDQWPDLKSEFLNIVMSNTGSKTC